ncbi:MAG: replicative DNA helicase [Deltaproteobacteria bacterium]|nr:replicative DNA helicase [Deltaproteobacteria bacterium]
MPQHPDPQVVQAERALLGGLLQKPIALTELPSALEPEDFYERGHQALFRLLQEMNRANEPIDLITVVERMNRQGGPERPGDILYVADLPSFAPSVENLPRYAQLIRDKAMVRRYIQKTEALLREAQSDPEDLADFLDRVQKQAVELTQSVTEFEWGQLSSVMDKNLVHYGKLQEEFLRRQESGDPHSAITGLPTGLRGLDALLAGLQRTDLLILAARPGMGKTSLALNMAMSAAKYKRSVVAVFSLEMGKEQLATRLLCAEARVDASRLRTGDIYQADLDKLTQKVEELRDLRLFIYDRPGLTMSEVRALSRRVLMEQGQIDMVVIDYLQLMSGDDRNASREQQISSISRGLKGLAKELKIPVLALSQLNRRVDERQDKRPKLSDLRESGAIEQDADIIMFIYRDEQYNADSEAKGDAEVIVAKHRAGPTGDIKVAFLKQHTLFRDREELDDGTDIDD